MSSLGLELLLLTGRKGARHAVHKVKMGGDIYPSLMLSLASLETEKTMGLEVGGISCTTEEEGRAMVSLLERCTSWRVEVLGLEGEVGWQTWERLGREVARGRLESVHTEREVVMRGRREDLWAVWRNTEVSWLVGIKEISKENGEREGWCKLEEMIQ